MQQKNLQNTKFIFVSGGVISGIGKGITVASVSLLLKKSGYKVTPIKFENYLNQDAGTINPIEHGDVFLCEDGTEADMDIGTYEKFLDQDMTRDNFVTMGQIYRTVLERERQFGYSGEDVEAIPHITDEIIHRIKQLAKKTESEIVIVELGGTAGEYQNILYYEASRLMTLRNPEDVIHIHVSYVPVPKHLGEPKTKPTQLSVKALNSMGIQPNIIIARSEQKLDRRRLDRFALFCNVHNDDIISSPDADNVYELPIILQEQNITYRILKKLGLESRTPDLSEWKSLIKDAKRKRSKKVTIGIVGKYFATGDYELRDSYASLFDAISHASWQSNVDIETKWVDAEAVEKKGTSVLRGLSGIIVPIGWGERGSEGMIQAATYARKNKIPYLGLCYGMQLAVVAFARDVLGYSDANTVENDPKTKHPVVHFIPNQKDLIKKRAYGGTMRLGAWDAVVAKDTQAYNIYEKHKAFKDKGKSIISERHRHRYEVNSEYEADLAKGGLIISAKSKNEGLVELIELESRSHPFYMATQGHPEYKSRPSKPHPLFVEFLNAAKKKVK